MLRILCVYNVLSCRMQDIVSFSRPNELTVRMKRNSHEVCRRRSVIVIVREGQFQLEHTTLEKNNFFYWTGRSIRRTQNNLPSPFLPGLLSGLSSGTYLRQIEAGRWCPVCQCQAGNTARQFMERLVHSRERGFCRGCADLAEGARKPWSASRCVATSVATRFPFISMVTTTPIFLRPHKDYALRVLINHDTENLNERRRS